MNPKLNKLRNALCKSCHTIYSFPVISIEENSVYAQCPMCGHKTEIDMKPKDVPDGDYEY